MCNETERVWEGKRKEGNGEDFKESREEKL